MEPHKAGKVLANRHIADTVGDFANLVAKSEALRPYSVFSGIKRLPEFLFRPVQERCDYILGGCEAELSAALQVREHAVAGMFGSNYIPDTKAAKIFDSEYISVDDVAMILANPLLGGARAAQILLSMAFEKAAKTMSNKYMISSGKVVIVLGGRNLDDSMEYLTPKEAGSFMGSVDMPVPELRVIFNSTLMPIDKLVTISLGHMTPIRLAETLESEYVCRERTLKVLYGMMEAGAEGIAKTILTLAKMREGRNVDLLIAFRPDMFDSIYGHVFEKVGYSHMKELEAEREELH
jgi:hypothetical protein